MKWWHLKKPILPRTYWGFPVDGEATSNDSAAEGENHLSMRGDESGRRGIALLLAILIVAIVMGFMSDLIISSSVNVELAQGSRDRLKAEYMGKSGQNLALFVTQIDWGIDLYMRGEAKKTMTDGIGDMWGALNGLPIGGATVQMMTSMQEKFDLGAVTDSGVLSQLGLFDGQFVVKTTDESSKINVNYCHKGRCTQVLLMLQALFSCPVEKAFLESKELDGRKLAFRIKDYIDDKTDAEAESGFSDENDPYTGLKDKYKAKNAPLDSVDEMKMIEGWDDQVHDVFSRYITVYPVQNQGRDLPQINLNTAAKELLMCLVPEGMNVDCKNKFMLTMSLQEEEKTNVTDDGDMRKALRDLLCYNSDGGGSSGGGGGDGSSGGKDDKNAGDKATWFNAASRVFRIEVEGEVGNQIRKLTTVIERLDSKDMKDKKNSKSYRLLYWKMT